GAEAPWRRQRVPLPVEDALVPASHRRRPGAVAAPDPGGLSPRRCPCSLRAPPEHPRRDCRGGHRTVRSGPITCVRIHSRPSCTTRHAGQRMNPNYLDFEQPIADLEAKIQELRNASTGPAVNVEAEVKALQDKLRIRTAQIFRDLTPWQVSQMARH